MHDTHPTAAAERPSNACATCPPPRQAGHWRLAERSYKACTDCYDNLREVLRDIAERYLMLDPTPGASGEHGGRGAPGFGSRPPASPHIIAMMDWRSSRDAYVWVGADGKVHREPERPTLSVPGELYTLAHHVARERGMAEPAPVVGEMVRWLDAQLDWTTRQEGVVGFAAVLRELQAQLRPVTGDPRSKIGVCPNVVDEGECGAKLYAPTRGDTIKCSACGRPWPRPAWEQLGKMLQAGAA